MLIIVYSAITRAAARKAADILLNVFVFILGEAEGIAESLINSIANIMSIEQVMNAIKIPKVTSKVQ